MKTKICSNCRECIGEDEWFRPVSNYGLNSDDNEKDYLEELEEEPSPVVTTSRLQPPEGKTSFQETETSNKTT